MRRRFIVISVLILVSGALGWGAYMLLEGVKCRRVIRSLVYGVTYERQMNGRYPVSIGVLLNGGPDGTAPEVKCPGVWRGYVYINWDEMGVPSPDADFPIIYDQKYSNHGGFGINVGTVGKRVFWDPDGKWLMNFREKHPEFRVPTPHK